MIKKILFVLTLLIACPIWAQSDLRKLRTDYCTNYPEGTPQNPTLWKDCCLVHDMFMWAGGNAQDRYDSDRTLLYCIQNKGAPYIARLMYTAVRAGSYSPVKYPSKKWNNGWPDRPDYQTLSVQDIDLISIELFSDYPFIKTAIKEEFIHLLRARLE